MQQQVLIVYVLLTAVGSEIAWLSCPSPSERCNCAVALEGYVNCEDMRTLPQNLPSTVEDLDLTSSTIGSALLKVQMKKLQHLTLKQLYLSNSGIEVIESRVFSTQRKIKTLDLSRNNLKKLDDQIFYGLEELEQLFLTQSSINEISPKVFVYTPALKYLDLAGNTLTKISSEFSLLSNLRSLLLSDNEISSIAAEAFETQLHLSRLMLYGNQLETPEKMLFRNVVANNGILKLNYLSAKHNPWRCCGPNAIDYRKFVDNLPVQLKNREQYDILCSTPEKFANQSIKDLDFDELKATECEAATTIKVVFKKGTNSTTAFTETSHQEESTTDISREVVLSQTNVLNNLTNAHIVAIFLASIVLAVAITAIVVHYYHASSSNNAFEEFVSNLPGSEDSDDEAAYTTKTYRHDAAVYGSTGNVVDRHINGTRNSTKANECFYDVPRTRSDPSSFASDDSDSSPDVTYDTPRPLETHKRKPPPYYPNPDSPERGKQGDHEQTQFNNSSSVGLHHTSLSSRRSNPFDNVEYASDVSDDLWNVATYE